MKNLIRTISLMIVTVLILSSVLPVSVYASSLLNDGGNNDAVVGTKIGPEDVTIQIAENFDSNKSTDEVMYVPVVIDTYNSTFIREASISFENSNFTIVNEKIADDKNIQSISNDVIKLNSSETDEQINLNIPVTFKKADYIPEDYFKRVANIKIVGTYVDKNGEDKTFEKSTKVNPTWYIAQEKKEILAKQEVVRSFSFEDGEKTNALVTLKITTGIEKNGEPTKGKEIKLTSAIINNVVPEVIVAADGYTYNVNEEDSTVTLTKLIEKNENNEYKWVNDLDVAYVTYFYKDIDNEFFNANKIIKFNTSIALLDSEEVLKKDSNELTIPHNLNNSITDVLLATSKSTASINRGYIISNINTENKFDTVLDINYKLNIGYIGLTKDVTVTENFNSNILETRKFSINGDEFAKVFGEDGKITIQLANGNDTYELNKNNTTFTVPSGNEIKEISFTQPTAVGNINLNFVKAVKNNAYELMKEMNKIEGSATFTNTDLYGNKRSTDARWITNIEEPTQKVHFESNFKTLSTIKKNEKMVLTIVLESDSVDDYLYKNPALRVTFPNAITNIENVTINTLYDDSKELSENILKSIDNNNKTITLNLKGLQTKYISSAVSRGILIQIVADLTLDRLSPTEETSMKLEVYNENTGLLTTLNKAFKVVAPSEFIIQNKMDVVSPTNNNGTGDKNYFKETRSTIEEEVEDITLPLYSNEKYADVCGTIVNNQGTDVNNAIIVGNFPSKDSNSYLGTQLNGTFDTKVVGEITVKGESEKTEENPNGTYKAYYSQNANEPINSNNWSETKTEDAKSYKIEFLDSFGNGDKKEFSYRVSTPSDITYNEHAKETFTLLYDNNAINGEKYSSIEAKPVGLSTKPESDFSVKIKTIDMVKNKEIKNNEEIDEGAYVKLNIEITNTSNRDISNVKAVTELTDHYLHIEVTKDKINHYYDMEDITEEITLIKASETKTITQYLMVNAIRDYEENSINLEDDNPENDAIYTKFNVNIYEDDEVEFKAEEYKNPVKMRQVSCITYSPDEQGEIGIGDKFQQILFIRNLTGVDKKNLEIKDKLPAEVEYDTEENDKLNGNGLTYSYNSNTREYSIKIDELKAYYLSNEIRLNLKTAKYGTPELKASVYENEKIEDFNNIKITVAGAARNFEVSHTISTPSNQLKDTDTFDFNIIIKNHWDALRRVKIYDRLNDNFIIKEYKILINNKEVSKHQNVNLIDYVAELNAEDYVEVRIKCGIKTQAKGEKINLTHEPEASCNGVKIAINPITINITGTGEFVNINDPIIDGKYNISGTAWLDANNNGKREDTEQKISNIRMKLVDNKTNKVVVDDSGKEIITTTNNNGEYIFTNIPIGSYVVIAYYDSEKYGCGDYRNRNVADDLNNDFIETVFENETVGATDNILVQNSNIYAIDISLIPRNTFDMALEKNVTSVSVSTSNGKNANYNYNSDIAKVEISNEKGIKYYLVVEYSLVVKNVGYVDGYAKSVVDYIPKGMTFNQEDNPGWYVKADGCAYNSTLTNTLIKGQTQKELKLKLRKEITAEQTGIIKNSAEIGEIYNIQGIEDINSKAGNKDSSENDYSEALVIIALSTGGQIIRVAGIIFGALSFGAVIIVFIKNKRKNKIV